MEEETGGNSDSKSGAKRSGRGKAVDDDAAAAVASAKKRSAAKTSGKAGTKTGAKATGKAKGVKAVADGTAAYEATPELTVEDVFNKIEETTRLMKAAAKQLEFEKAAELRDELGILRQQLSDLQDVRRKK